MTSKKVLRSLIVACITAILAVAVCGCEDLGVYGDKEDYYNSFGDVIMISQTLGKSDGYSVEDYFYNEDSRENFLCGEDGVYNGIEHSDYIYMAIPFENDIEMDTLALYIQAENDVTVYINVFVTDTIPSNWKLITDNVIGQEDENETTDDVPADEVEGVSKEDTEDGDEEENDYDDPDPETRIGEIAVRLEKGKWGSFVLDVFSVNGAAQKSIQINDGQYILLQIRNNSGVRVFDEEKQVFVDPQTGLELSKAQITMTNLMIRALDIEYTSETQGGE